MHMIRKNRAGVNRIISLIDRPREPASDRAGLDSGKEDGRVLQRPFGFLAQLNVMRDMGDGAARGDLGRTAETKQFPRPDKVAP